MDAALEHRVQRSQALQRGVAQALVARDDVPLARRLLLLVEHRRLDPTDLPVEPALGPGLLGLLLGCQPERVDVLAGDAAPLGDPLGGLELVGHVDIPGLRADRRAVRTRVGAQPDAAHRLDAARDADIDGAGGDQAGDQVVGLLAAAALAVHGGGADMFGQTRGQPRHPADVVGLLPVLGHAAADHLLDLAGVDAGLVHQCLLHGAQQLGRMQARQPSIPLADRAAGGFNDDRVTHPARLEHVSLL